MVQGWTFSLRMANIHITPMRHLCAVRCDDGIPVVESWLISATEYIAIGSTPPQLRIYVDRRLELARPDQSGGYAKLKSQHPLFVFLIIANNKLCCIHSFALVVFVALARFNLVIYIFIALVYQSCIPDMTVWILLAAACPLVGLGGRWRHGWWMSMTEELWAHLKIKTTLIEPSRRPHWCFRLFVHWSLWRNLK